MSAASTSTSPAPGASAVSGLLATTTPDGQAARERRVERAFGGAGTATIEAALVCFRVVFFLGAAPAGASFFLLLAIFTEIAPTKIVPYRQFEGDLWSKSHQTGPYQMWREAMTLPGQRARAPLRIW